VDLPLQLLRVTSYSYPNLFVRLAKDFFSKLCAYPPSERYDAKMALQHPWITGVGGQADIPLTRKEKLKLFSIQIELKRAIRSVLFCAMVKDGKDGSKRSPIDREYIKRIMLSSQSSDCS
jgi:serine/threonine protein kinase